MTILVRLFGAFREYGDSLTLSVPAGVTVREVRPLVVRELDKLRPGRSAAGLVGSAAVGSRSEILTEDGVVPTDEIALLPPVCGGAR